MATGEEHTSAGDKLVAKVDSVADVIGTLVPTVSAIGSMVRLIAAAVRPTDAQKAQAFDAAIAEFDQKIVGLNSAVAGFEPAKAKASAPKANPVGAMTAKTAPAGQKAEG